MRTIEMRGVPHIGFNSRTHLNRFALDSDMLLSLEQLSTEASRCLIADYEQCAVLIGKNIPLMAEHPTTRRHAGTRNDNLCSRLPRECFGFARSLDHSKLRKREYVLSPSDARTDISSEIVRI